MTLSNVAQMLAVWMLSVPPARKKNTGGCGGEVTCSSDNFCPSFFFFLLIAE